MAGRIASLWNSWHHFNTKFFSGKLTPPTSIRITRSRRYDGMLIYGDNWKAHRYPPVRIYIADDVPLRKESATLLHEMVHQYQVQVLREEATHDQTFRTYCKWIERQTPFRLR